MIRLNFYKKGYMMKFGKLFVEQKLLKKGCKNYKPSPQGRLDENMVITDWAIC